MAILLVLIWHFGNDVNSAGNHRWLFYLIDANSLFWSGVVLFFVLSEFLIGGILLDARNSPYYFKAFYARRFFRIIPVYAVVVGAFYLCEVAGVPGRTAATEWLFGSTVKWHAYATYTQNIGYAIGVPNLANWPRATWSLAIEEQFYFILPALIWFVPRRGLPYVPGSTILVAPLSRLFLNISYSQGKLAIFYLMPCRADALLLGVAAAMLVRLRSTWEWLRIQRRWLALVWIALPAGLLFYHGLLLLALLSSDGRFRRILRNSWLKALGTISYGVYLIHMPVLGLTFVIFMGKNLWAETSAERGFVLLVLAMTFAVASASYVIFEKPLLKISHRVKY